VRAAPVGAVVSLYYDDPAMPLFALWSFLIVGATVLTALRPNWMAWIIYASVALPWGVTWLTLDKMYDRRFRKFRKQAR
jgi:hypothetical protein